MTAVVIGIDPHKRSNTALVLDAKEKVLAKQRFPNDRDGYRQLKRFARPWRDRTWAVEAPGASVWGWRSGSPPTVSSC
jgi:transposase